MPTAAEVAAAETYRAQQAAVRDSVIEELLLLWPLLDKARLGESTPGWLRVAVALARRWRLVSHRVTVTYLGRAYEGRGLPPPRLAVPSLDEERAVRNLLHGVGEVKRARLRGLSPAQADRAGAALTASAAGTLALDAGRATVDEVVASDPVALGWMRVTDADPCAFCAMLASRGPVYRSAATAGGTDPRDLFDGEDPVSHYHNGCQCVVVPVFDRTGQVPASSARWADLWATATKGLSGHEARLAFRRAVEGRDRT